MAATLFASLLITGVGGSSEVDAPPVALDQSCLTYQQAGYCLEGSPFRPFMEINCAGYCVDIEGSDEGDGALAEALRRRPDGAALAEEEGESGSGVEQDGSMVVDPMEAGGAALPPCEQGSAKANFGLFKYQRDPNVTTILPGWRYGVLGLAVEDCAWACMSESLCVAFDHRKEDGKCVLRSVGFPEVDLRSSTTWGYYLRKKRDSGIPRCVYQWDTPTTIRPGTTTTPATEPTTMWLHEFVFTSLPEGVQHTDYVSIIAVVVCFFSLILFMVVLVKAKTQPMFVGGTPTKEELRPIRGDRSGCRTPGRAPPLYTISPNRQHVQPRSTSATSTIRAVLNWKSAPPAEPPEHIGTLETRERIPQFNTADMSQEASDSIPVHLKKQYGATQYGMNPI